MKKIKIKVLIILLGLSIGIHAQDFKIPFKLVDNSHVLLKVKVNDSNEELDFVFDTGASAGVIDKSTAKKLGLKAGNKVRVPGAGGVQTYELIRNQRLKINDQLQMNLPYLISVDMTRFHEITDEFYAGIIGYNVISRYVTQMDFQNEELLLYKSIKNVNLSGYKKIPFSFHSGAIPVIETTFTLKGEEYTGKVLFDTGAALSLSVNTPFVKEYKLSSIAEKKVIRKSENLGTTSTSESIAIESVELGGFTFKDLTITLSDDSSGVSSYNGYLGILGAKILQRFHVVLDYKNQNLYLKPNSKFDESFEFPLTSIRFKKKDGKIVIDDVSEDSEEYRLGLRKADCILSINNISSKKLKPYKDELKKEGNKVTIKVEKPSKQVETYSFKLRNLLKSN